MTNKTTETTEKMFYNAVAITLEGSPYGMRLLVERLKKLNEGVFPGWVTAYEYLASGAADGGLGIRGRLGSGRKGAPPPKPYSENMTDVELEEENLEQREIRLAFFDEPEYPALLRHIHDAPLALYVRGEVPEAIVSPAVQDSSKAAPALTIVGTRRGTPDGKRIACSFARELAAAGFTIVSGLAFGIDAAAHEGCLEASTENHGAGKTVAVLARGVDKFYPREHENLGWRILESGGAIISEYPPGEPPYPDRFIERNRIVSGLSPGTLVIECPERSGSLATANLAHEQDRDVFVVPGPITHPNFFESHKLIRQGATLVTKPEHILEVYGFGKKEKFARALREANNEEKQVLLALHGSKHALDVDKIIELTKLEPRVANRVVSLMLVKQLIEETKSGYIIE